MKLDRNARGQAKYAAIRLRQLGLPENASRADIIAALMREPDALVLCDGADEFFLIMLKDRYANPALVAYGNAAFTDDQEYGDEVFALADRAGLNSPHCKTPD